MRIGVRILWAAGLASALASGPAFAQFKADKEADPYQVEAEARKKQQDEIDKQYKVMRKHTESEAKAIKIDPWQNMRSAEDKPKR